MAASNNNGGFSRMGTDPTVSGLRDGTDFPHSGIYHALNSATQGNYAIIDGNNFNITQTDVASNSRFVVAAGRVFRDGALVAEIATATFNQGTPSTFDEPTSGNAYFLLVVNSSNALAILGDKATTDLVPNLTNRDEIPIAVIRLTSGENYDARHIQFLTTSKDENSLSIGHNDSGYTEAMSITSNAGDVTLENKVLDKDIIIKGNDGGVSTTIATFDVSGKTLVVPTGVVTNTLTLGYDVGPSVIYGYNPGDNLQIYAVGDSGGNVKILELDAGTDGAEANRIATVTGNLHVSTNVGIGTTSPSEMLHLSDADASEPTILIENTGTSTTEPNLMFKRSGSHPSDPTVDIGRIGFEGDNDADQNTLYAVITGDAHVATDGDERGRIRFHVMRAGAITEILRLGGFEAVFNEGGGDVNFRVEGSSEANLLFADAGNNRIGIGTNAPDTEFHVTGASNPTITLQETGQTGHVKLTALQDSSAQLIAENETASENCQFNIDSKAMNGGTQEIRLFRNSNSGADGYFAIKQTGTINNAFLFYSDKDGTAHQFDFSSALRITAPSSDVTISNIVDDKDLIFSASTSSATNEIMRIDSTQQAVSIGTATSNDAKLTVDGTISRKGLIRNVITVAGDASSIPPVVSYPVLETDDLIIASAPSGGVPPNSLDVMLPDATQSVPVGKTYRIVATDVTAGLTLNRTGSDDVFVDEQFAPISLPFSLSLGKIYDITCVEANKWMVMTLN